MEKWMVGCGRYVCERAWELIRKGWKKSEAFGSTWGMWLPKASVLLFDEWGKFFSRLGEVTSHSSEATSRLF